jgi:hypothetical protein
LPLRENAAQPDIIMQQQRDKKNIYYYPAQNNHTGTSRTGPVYLVTFPNEDMTPNGDKSMPCLSSSAPQHPSTGPVSARPAKRLATPDVISSNFRKNLI